MHNSELTFSVCVRRVMAMLTGTMRSMTPTPASTEGPRTVQSSARVMSIWRGADQSTLR